MSSIKAAVPQAENPYATDRSNRRNIVAVSVFIWSFMTAVSGFAQNYAHLLLARIGVGIGEAGGSPPSHSIISDIFPPEKRASALGFYSTGVGIGILFGFLLGGWLNEYFGWRVAFMVVGAPGILLACYTTSTWVARSLPPMLWSACACEHCRRPFCFRFSILSGLGWARWLSVT